MRRLLVVPAVVLLAGCTVPAATPAPTTPATSTFTEPATTPTPSDAATSPGVLATDPAATPSEASSPETQPSDAPSDVQPSAGPPDPIASAEETPTEPSASGAPAGAAPADSLEAAFAQPEAGGIGAFLAQHPDYLPGTATIGDVIVSGASRGPLDLNLTNLPAGTTRVFMTLACASPSPYRMELLRADGTMLGGSWSENCGYWGGLHGYTTAPFPADAPPARFHITVDPGTRYSYVVYAVPGQ